MRRKRNRVVRVCLMRSLSFCRATRGKQLWLAAHGSVASQRLWAVAALSPVGCQRRRRVILPSFRRRHPAGTFPARMFHPCSGQLCCPLMLEETATAAFWQVCAGVCQTYRRRPACEQVRPQRAEDRVFWCQASLWPEGPCLIRSVAPRSGPRASPVAPV